MRLFKSQSKNKYLHFIATAMFSFVSVQYGFSAENHQDPLSNGTSRVDQYSAEELATLVQEEFDKCSSILEKSKGKDLVFFLGNTGSGKSTFGNFLGKKHLRMNTDEDGGYVLENPADENAMPIGGTLQSETLYPQALTIDDLTLIDFPGLNDTGGTPRNLVNSALMKKILTHASSVKFIVFLSESDLDANRGQPAKELIDSIQSLFALDVLGHSMLTVTKSTKSWYLSREKIIEKMQGLDPEIIQKPLLRWIDGQKLCRFRTACDDRVDERDGGLNNKTRDHIIAIIKNIVPVQVTSLNTNPQQTDQYLVNMFLDVMNRRFEEMMSVHPQTVSHYDREIAIYDNPDFWTLFHQKVLSEAVINLLKEFFDIQYSDAQSKFNKEQERQCHLQRLRISKISRESDVRQLTDDKILSVLDKIVRKRNGIPERLDSSYHDKIEEAVYGEGNINLLSTDPTEHVIIREQYKTFIDKYVEQQEQQLLAVYLNPLRQLLETEQQRVIRLQQSLQTEVTRAQTAEAALHTSLSTEQQRVRAAEEAFRLSLSQTERQSSMQLAQAKEAMKSLLMNELSSLKKELNESEPQRNALRSPHPAYHAVS